MLEHAFVVATVLVAIGEIGDKTQLLAFALAQRYRTPWLILAGILAATLLNHGLSVLFGQWAAQHFSMFWLTLILGVGFIVLGLWMLIPDKEESVDAKPQWNAFIATFVLFFLAEIGDKTQLATVALAARFPDAFWHVLLGSTLGMLLANIPAIWLGATLTHPRWQRIVHRFSAALFVLFGLATLWQLV
ncbi:MAG TPA: TMEM165/GDT1 family protein [Alcanivoracaceae bacterium]|nr:TMEM165/GDT1 family protein [Alcanivoracaceae bacterium]